MKKEIRKRDTYSQYITLNLLLIISCITFLFYSTSVANTNPLDSTDYPLITKEAVTLLQKYLRIPSETGNEKAAGEFLARFCEELGLHVFHFSEEINSYNFAASLYPLVSKKPNVILLNHIDVVPVGDSSLWSHPPFEATIDSGLIYGRGAIDMKGQAIMQLMAMKQFIERAKDEDLPYNITLLSVSNEEKGGRLGAKIIVDNFMDFLNPSVVLGEGGGGLTNVLSSDPDAVVFGISIAEKMSLWLKLSLVIDGGGHGAAPSLDYANLRMITALNKLNNRKVRLKFHRSTRMMFRGLGKEEGGLRGFFIGNINWSLLAPIVKRQMRNDPFVRTLLTNTITVTNFYNPPGPPNQVSILSEVYLDCRLLPGQNKKAFIRQIKNLLDDDAIMIHELEGTPEVESTRPDEYYDLLAESIKSVYPESRVLPFLFPASTDNSYFRTKDVPVYGLTPAITSEEFINSVHAPNERISIDMLQSGIFIYIDFIERVQNMNQEKRRLLLLNRDKKE